MTLLATLLLGAAVAVADDVPLPSSPPTSTLPAGAPPPGEVPAAAAPVAPATGVAPLVATTPATPATTPFVGLRALRLGMRGSDVRDLQRELRRRGVRVAMDGAFGPATRAAVRKLQSRMRLLVSGVADLTLLRRLGLRARGVASAGAGTTDPSTGVTQGVAPLAAPVPDPSRTGKYLKVFPLNGTHTYQDDFGDPRGQGRHEGNDIMSPRDTPVVAVADGTIDRLTRVETGLGGIWIWLRDTAGNTYYYCHMDHIADGLQPGDKVTVGQTIGFVGNTGDARYGATHLHFEIHPGGGNAVDPYRELRAVDPLPQATAR